MSYSEIKTKIDPFLIFSVNLYAPLGANFFVGTGFNFTDQQEMKNQWLSLKGGLRFYVKRETRKKFHYLFNEIILILDFLQNSKNRH